MKKILAGIILLAFPFTGNARQDDPILIKVNGKSILRSEFEYAYNKNRNISENYNNITVDDYVNLYIDYQLKVAAAEDAKLDTLSSFRNEYAKYRDAQLVPYLIDSVFVDSITRRVYNNIKEKVGDADLVHVAHIFFRVPQRASKEKRDQIRLTADSIYTLLMEKGMDFGVLAKKYSEDYATAKDGGVIPWFGPNAALPEFEEQVYALQPGGTSRPFLSTAGFHIVRMLERKKLEPYEVKKVELITLLKKQGLDELACESMIKKLIAASGGKKTREDIAREVIKQHESDNPNMKYLIKEYHDGLLLFEIVNREVWEKVASDEVGLETFFKEHKSSYKWDEPRFKGFLIQAKSKSQLSKAKKILKKNKNGDWKKAIDEEFNKENVNVHVIRSLFKKGDNIYVDKCVFKKKDVAASKYFPYCRTYGKKIKSPQDYTDVKEVVKTDYQRMKEKEWVMTLHEKYKVEIDRDVLRTVNKH